MLFRPSRVANLAFAITLTSVLMVPALYGQTSCGTSTKVGCVIPNLFGKTGTTGITLPQGTHSAHFLDPQHFSENFLPLNTAVATQLTLLPLPSPASGFSYEVGSSGLSSPRAQTLGPILTERGETLGTRRLFLGAAYQRFHFDKIDDIDLDTLPIFFTHLPGTGLGGTVAPYEADVISTQTKIDLKIDQMTLFGSFGLTDRLDISAAVPVMHVNLKASSLATINRISGATCGAAGNPCHFFDPANPAGSTSSTFTNTGSATGIGDITLRVKQNIHNSARFSAAVLGDVRLPTGDENDFLGSGTTGVKPFVAISFKRERFAPHVNIGYQWNGKSTLAGNLSTGAKASLPDQFFYSFGTEVSLHQNFTLSTDWIGQRVFDGTRVSLTKSTVSGTQFSGMVFPTQSYGMNNISVGFKYAIANRFLATVNASTSVDKGGLRQRVTPLIGVSYLF